MEILSIEFFSALAAIIVIDLVLGGDNAIVIGMAARNPPQQQQRQVIIWGTIGAIIIRVISTLIVVWLLKIPGLLLIGGIMLVGIAYKLLVESKDHSKIEAGPSMGAAIRTIIIADAVMGIDNILAVAGAAHGNFLTVVLGLLISIPIVVWGSTLCIKCLDRYPSLIYIGAGVLAWTAGKMITGEPMIQKYIAGNILLQYGIIVAIVLAVIAAGRSRRTFA